MVYSENGIEWAKDDKEASYLSLFQNITLQASLTPKQAIKKFPKGIPYDYSCTSTKDVLTGRLCYHCGLYFGTIKSNVNHSSYCRTKAEASTASVTRKVRPQRVAARRQKELFCAMVFQELEWHAINDVDFDFDDNQVDISEIAPKSGTPVIEDIQPIWSSD